MSQVVLLSDISSKPRFGSSRYMAPYALAGQLEASGFSVVVIDYFTQKKDFFDYLKHFLSAETLVVGISTTFLNPPAKKNRSSEDIETEQDRYDAGHLWFHSAIELTTWFAELRATIEAVAPNCKIIVGGAKTLSAFLNPDIYSKVDYLCVGAGDDSLTAAVTALASGSEPQYFERKGHRILSGVTLKNKRTECPEARLDHSYGIQLGESLPIEISRGCVFNCKFCHYEKKESIKKELGVLRNELLRNYENFGTTVYHFTDDCFNDHREKVESTCSMFLSLPFKIEWVSYARVDVAVKFPHTLSLMVEAGARGLFWGLESFDEDTARRAGKGTSTERVKQLLIEFQRDYGGECISAGSFIVGLPGESEESIQRTIDWLCTHKALDYIYVAPLNLAPYSTDLDKVVIDYAEYSRNPEKYGFKKISFAPDFWEHDQMNSHRAKELTASFVAQWQAHYKTNPVNSMWLYPHMRTLGFSHEEIFRALHDHSYSQVFAETAAQRNSDFRSRYFEKLQLNHHLRKRPKAAPMPQEGPLTKS